MTKAKHEMNIVDLKLDLLTADSRIKGMLAEEIMCSVLDLPEQSVVYTDKCKMLKVDGLLYKCLFVNNTRHSTIKTALKPSFTKGINRPPLPYLREGDNFLIVVHDKKKNNFDIAKIMSRDEALADYELHEIA